MSVNLASLTIDQVLDAAGSVAVTNFCNKQLAKFEEKVKKTQRAVWDRLQREVDIINHMGFPAYMLIVAEFINWSKDNAIPVGPGRGSAAGKLARSVHIRNHTPQIPQMYWR